MTVGETRSLVSRGLKVGMCACDNGTPEPDPRKVPARWRDLSFILPQLPPEAPVSPSPFDQTAGNCHAALRGALTSALHFRLGSADFCP